MSQSSTTATVPTKADVLVCSLDNILNQMQQLTPRELHIFKLILGVTKLPCFFDHKAYIHLPAAYKCTRVEALDEFNQIVNMVAEYGRVESFEVFWSNVQHLVPLYTPDIYEHKIVDPIEIDAREIRSDHDEQQLGREVESKIRHFKSVFSGDRLTRDMPPGTNVDFGTRVVLTGTEWDMTEPKLSVPFFLRADPFMVSIRGIPDDAYECNLKGLNIHLQLLKKACLDATSIPFDGASRGLDVWIVTEHCVTHVDSFCVTNILDQNTRLRVCELLQSTSTIRLQNIERMIVFVEALLNWTKTFDMLHEGSANEDLQYYQSPSRRDFHLIRHMLQITSPSLLLDEPVTASRVASRRGMQYSRVIH